MRKANEIPECLHKQLTLVVVKVEFCEVEPPHKVLTLEEQCERPHANDSKVDLNLVLKSENGFQNDLKAFNERQVLIEEDVLHFLFKDEETDLERLSFARQ